MIRHSNFRRGQHALALQEPHGNISEMPPAYTAESLCVLPHGEEVYFVYGIYAVTSAGRMAAGVSYATAVAARRLRYPKQCWEPAPDSYRPPVRLRARMNPIVGLRRPSTRQPTSGKAALNPPKPVLGRLNKATQPYQLILSNRPISRHTALYMPGI